MPKCEVIFVRVLSMCPLLTPVTQCAPLAVRPLMVFAFRRVHLFVFPTLWIGVVRRMTRYFPDAGGFILPVFPNIPIAFQTHPLPRRNGPPGVNSAAFNA